MNMAKNKLGSHTFRPGQPVYIAAWAAVGGKKEAEGPLGHGFDVKSMDTKFGEKTWEQAEKKMQQLALYKLLDKARIHADDVDLVFSGDLLNQCIGSSFTLRNTGIPHLGLYGACSTMAQSLLLSAMAVGGGYADRVIAMTSSHFAGSERQYRFPLGYGGQRTPTAQWTVTGSGAALVTAEQSPVSIESATIGTVTDLGITDANNMGAAMAPVDVKLRPSRRDALWLHTFTVRHQNTGGRAAAPPGSDAPRSGRRHPSALFPFPSKGCRCRLRRPGCGQPAGSPACPPLG